MERLIMKNLTPNYELDISIVSMILKIVHIAVDFISMRENDYIKKD